MPVVPRPENVVIGSALVALGVLWTLANLGRIDLLATLRTWWPTTLVLWGTLELYNTLSRRGTR
ncbi:MAG: hypothetical protein HY317_05460 [Acidobacteria bacterium]|nr:hypothetical protein [Acidobacteriota bacterium]